MSGLFILKEIGVSKLSYRLTWRLLVGSVLALSGALGGCTHGSLEQDTLTVCPDRLILDGDHIYGDPNVTDLQPLRYRSVRVILDPRADNDRVRKILGVLSQLELSSLTFPDAAATCPGSQARPGSLHDQLRIELKNTVIADELERLLEGEGISYERIDTVDGITISLAKEPAKGIDVLIEEASRSASESSIDR